MLHNPLSSLGNSGGNVQIFEGSYTGDGTTTRNLEFPFQPKFVWVIIYDWISTSSYSSVVPLRPFAYGERFGMVQITNTNKDSTFEKVPLTWSGTKLTVGTNSNGLNNNYAKYRYYGITW